MAVGGLASCKRPLADIRTAPTPLRQQQQRQQPMLFGRSAEEEVAPAAASAPGMHPAEAKSLSWPGTFCPTCKGERLELSDGGAFARRSSGVGFGAAFVGPLTLEKGAAYFEVEVAELEQGRSQTMAIGLCCGLPPEGRAARAERARDLGGGAYMVGYDLPKVYANGVEVAKLTAKQWRPLKELAVGDCIGLLIDRVAMELTVFVNGARRASATVPGPEGTGSARWPSEVWGVVDVHGTLRAARVRTRPSRGPPAAAPAQRPPAAAAPSAARTQALAAPAAPAALAASAAAAPPAVTAQTAAPLSPAPQLQQIELGSEATLAVAPCPAPVGSAPGFTPASASTCRLASTQDMGGEPPWGVDRAAPAAAPNQAEPLDGTAEIRPRADAANSPSSLSRGASRSCVDLGGRPKKRLRMNCHPCGCLVHLLRETGDVVHVPRMGDFVIGRNPRSSNLTLDSEEVPNMVSRRHAVIVSAEDAVMIVDCESVNGTFVNGRRIGRETLRQGDELVVGNPAQCPSSFRFSVSMPPSSAGSSSML